MSKKHKFHCIQCGECCRNLQFVEALKTFHNGNGICMYLDEETNLCRIYKKRPLICNVEKCYDVFFADTMTKQEYYALNYKGCEMHWERKKRK